MCDKHVTSSMKREKMKEREKERDVLYLLMDIYAKLMRDYNLYVNMSCCFYAL